MSAAFSAAVDDIFDGQLESTSQSESGPYVINLSSSSAPVSLPTSGIPLTPKTRVYTTRGVDDRRVRYRLRLGPFLTESQANTALSMVRESYPAAFAAPASSEDLQEFDDIEFDAVVATPETKPAPAANVSVAKPAAVTPLPAPKAVASPTVKIDLLQEIPTLATPAVTVPKMASVRTQPVPAAKASAPAKAQAPATPAVQGQIKSILAEPAKPADATARTPVKPVTAVVSAPVKPVPVAATTPAKPVSAASAPMKPVAVVTPPAPMVVPPKVLETRATIELTLVPDAVAAAPLKPAAQAQAGSKTGGTSLAREVSNLLDSISLELVSDDKPQAGKGNVEELPHRQAPPSMRRASEERESDLESTQTMRALTSAELADTNKNTHWFSIELSVSDKAFDPDSVPDLDIFSAYRLYVIKSEGPGGAIHALRLGFFGSDIAAKAVAGYLTDHYQKAAVMRVSNAERERFSQECVEARKRVEGTGKHSVIEITDQRYIREISLAER
jgi:hypothetical protein